MPKHRLNRRDSTRPTRAFGQKLVCAPIKALYQRRGNKKIGRFNEISSNVLAAVLPENFNFTGSSFGSTLSSGLNG